MADLNAAGGTTFGGLQTSASASVKAWLTELIAPDDLQSDPSTSPALRVRQTARDGGSAQVQLQVSTSSDFASTVHDSTATQSSGAIVTRIVTGLVDGTTYSWRARAGDGISWGPWSSTRRLRIKLDAGKAHMPMPMNVGVQLTSDPDANAPMPVNVGAQITVDDSWPVYIFQNVGVQITLDDSWPAYIYANVDTSTPTPHIWYLAPTSGRAGDGIAVVGWGFGDLQTTYAGLVELNVGGEWVAANIVSWQTFPADADGYSDTRELDQIMGVIDMQHTIIGITIPEDAMPPGYPLRVRTDGP